MNDETTFNTVSKIWVVSVDSDEIIFQGVWKISVASVVDDKTIFRVVLNVSVASDEITFHVFFNIDVVDVVVMKLFYMYSQKST